MADSTTLRADEAFERHARRLRLALGVAVVAAAAACEVWGPEVAPVRSAPACVPSAPRPCPAAAGSGGLDLLLLMSVL